MPHSEARAARPRRWQVVEVASCRPSLQLRDAAPEGGEGALRLLYGFQPFPCDLEKSLSPASTFGRWIAVSRGHKAVLFQPVQRGVDRAQQNGTLARLLNFPRNRDAISVLSDTQDGEQDHEFEVGQMLPSHLFTNYEYIASLSSSRPSGRTPESCSTARAIPPGGSK